MNSSLPSSVEAERGRVSTLPLSRKKADTVKLAWKKPARVVKRWVVVTDPGTIHQSEAGEFAIYTDASRFCNMLNADNQEADVMSRLPDGTLTTEY